MLNISLLPKSSFLALFHPPLGIPTQYVTQRAAVKPSGQSQTFISTPVESVRDVLISPEFYILDRTTKDNEELTD